MMQEFHSHLGRAFDVASSINHSVEQILPTLMSRWPINRFREKTVLEGIIYDADYLLLTRNPQLALIAAASRRKLIKHYLDLILDSLILAEDETSKEKQTQFENTSPNLAGSSRVSGSGISDLFSGDLGIGVRSIITECTAGVSEDAFSETVGALLPDWQVEKLSWLDDFYRLHMLSKESVSITHAWDICNVLDELPDIEYVEPDIYQLPEHHMPLQSETIGPEFSLFSWITHWGMEPHKIPEANDENDWALNKVFVKEVWESGKKGEGVMIGHVDTGYTNHPEILPNIRKDLGLDTWDNDTDPLDDLSSSLWDKIRAKVPIANPGHGTATASVIASPVGKQNGHDGVGVTGSAPLTNIIPIRSTPTVVILPTGSQDEVAKGIVSAIERGAEIISMSLGSPYGSKLLNKAVFRAHEAGIIVCAAAGNVVLKENWITSVTYPAAYPSVIAVAGCDYHYRPWRDTCRGEEVTVTAPGTQVWRASASKNGFNSGQGSGTSYAVALIAGIAANWINHWGGRQELLSRFNGTARMIPEAFLYCLNNHQATSINIPDSEPEDLPDYPKFNASDFGVGVVNCVNLMNTELPDSVGPELSIDIKELSNQTSILSEISRWLPNIDRHNLFIVLKKELGLSRDELSDFLRVNGREFLHHLVTSRAIRSSLKRASETFLYDTLPESSVPLADAGVTNGEVSLVDHLRLHGSESLISRLTLN